MVPGRGTLLGPGHVVRSEPQGTHYVSARLDQGPGCTQRSRCSEMCLLQGALPPRPTGAVSDTPGPCLLGVGPACPCPRSLGPLPLWPVPERER